MANSSADIVDEGYAILDAEDYAMLGLGIQTDEVDDGKYDEANFCAPSKTPHPEEAEACATTSDSMNDNAPTAGKKRGRPEGCEISEPTKLKSARFIDLNGVPPQPLIMKKQLDATCYKNNSTSSRRPTKEGRSKYTGVSYNKNARKWQAKIWVQGKGRSIGYYDKEEDAAADYARAAFKYKPTKPSLQTYGGWDLSSVPTDLPLIRKEENATGYAGVRPNNKRFEANICVGGKQKSLGTFDTAEEAALIYARAKYYCDINEVAKRGRQEGSKNSKPSHRAGKGFIDLTGVPPQPLILKNQLSGMCYKDNTRRRPIKAGSSKYTGIYYDKKLTKWKAQIMVQGKPRSIGYFDKEEDAAADYARAAFKYKPTKQSLQAYGGLDLSNVPETLPLIRSEKSSTGYAGVKLTRRGRFEARIGFRGKAKTLGIFDTAEEAALVHARARHYMDQNELSKPKCGGWDLSGVPNDLPLIRKESNATGYAGVRLNKKRFEATICVGGKQKTLGTFGTAEEAALIHARAKYYLYHKGQLEDEKKKPAPVEPPSEKTDETSKTKSGGVVDEKGQSHNEIDEDPVDSCFINIAVDDADDADDKVDGVAV